MINEPTGKDVLASATLGRGSSPSSQKKAFSSQNDRPWYKTGVIYELHVRSFYDSNADGTGDFRGLTQKLGYIKDLGVTAIWLLPFYPSPLRDDGYDIADYCDVHPKYGTLADFKTFLRTAHRHNLRVITELVLNHTSDQHPWFQRARYAKPGSLLRDYYVWSETAERFHEARVIFRDVETSNWTWDKIAGAYYWHRFFSHQPDLNYDHLPVRDSMIKIVDFWLDLGVDGLRLDAVPYLFERDGTTCENLPETHEFLKSLRRHVDSRYGGRMLLAEANQWPEEAVTYFGNGEGDECHMAFHFPLMPRMFMALRMEDRVPVVDILQQTPEIPETAQWALFLRNHDELTLEMVTDEERDYMYRMYTKTRQAQLNLGIRRRLAPLLGNDRKRIELLCALLFSLPGTPVIYYGDEIGLGENIYLGDRDGVRTPMQWSADKNAGFSRGNPQSLYLPVNLDPENHYEAINVEVQDRNPYSLLWWMKRLIAIYKRHEALSLGTIEFLHPDNRKVFACVRRYQGQSLLVVANLSRFIQPVQLDLGSLASRVPVELFGRNEFPPITNEPYFLSLGPHAFYWFSLEAKAPAQVELVGAPVGAEVRPVLTVEEAWEDIFHPRNQLPLEQALQNWLPSRRWFGGRAWTMRGVHVRELIPVTIGTETTLLTFLQVEYVQSEPETYFLLLTCAFGDQADSICRDWPALVVARVTSDRLHREGVLYDALAHKEFGATLLKLLSSRRNLAGKTGRLEASHTSTLRRLRLENALSLEPSSNKAEQTNSSIVYGDQLILKIFRRLEPGMNPELEITRFLSAQKFPHVPPLAGALEYRGPKDELTTLAVLTSFVPGCTNAWDYTLDALSRFYDRVQGLPADQRREPHMPPARMSILDDIQLSEQARELLSLYVESVRSLGQITAALHIALASETADPNFKPEPFTPYSQRALFQSLRNLTRQNLYLLSLRSAGLPPKTRALAQHVLNLEGVALDPFRSIYERRIDAVRIRHHNDYHLGQVLYTGKDFLIIDFEGPTAGALSERRLKGTPLRDVAGMLLSFRHAAHMALSNRVKQGTLSADQMETLVAWSRFWSKWVSFAFYHAYSEAVGTAAFLPSNKTDQRAMMDFSLLHKAITELGNALNHHPDRVEIPLEAILEILDSSR
jgi:maltose alpha-D-glucosyltransferase/alpha-amylase